MTTASAQDLAACTKAGMAKSQKISLRWCQPHPLPDFPLRVLYWRAAQGKGVLLASLPAALKLRVHCAGC